MQEIIELLSQVEEKLELIDKLNYANTFESRYEIQEEIEQLTLLVTAIKHKVGLKI